jgi:hypothetical protein
LKFYKQKVKHLQYEHQNNLTDCKAEALVSLKMAQDDHTEQERELLRDKRDLKAQMREQELAHQDQIKSLKLVSCCKVVRLVLSVSVATKRRDQQHQEPVRAEGKRTGEQVREEIRRSEARTEHEAQVSIRR